MVPECQTILDFTTARHDGDDDRYKQNSEACAVICTYLESNHHHHHTSYSETIT